MDPEEETGVGGHVSYEDTLAFRILWNGIHDYVYEGDE